MLFDLPFSIVEALTAYPSIPTYHVLGQRGRLTSEITNPFIGRVIAKEKIDGTNARFVVRRGDYFIGSRNELLYARGDRIINPTNGIVAALKEIAEYVCQHYPFDAPFSVFYFEVFGGKVTKASPNYTGSGAVSFRLFDIAVFSNPDRFSGWNPSQISIWRESGKQEFLDYDALHILADQLGLPIVPTVYCGTADQLPVTLEGMRDFIHSHLPTTRVAIDDGGKGQAEGIVFRSPDRAVIAKARIEDYQRTLR